MKQIQLYDIFQKNQSICNFLANRGSRKMESICFKQYRISRQLGRGSFATVYKATNILTDKAVALKIINIQEINERYKPDLALKVRNYLQAQQANMKKCKTAYIVKLYDSFTNSKCKVLVMEYCNGGTLEKYLIKHGGFMEKDAVIMLKDILFGLAEMHRNGIIHRDFKPANILSHNGILKIADLGFSKELEDDMTSTKTVLGTKATMAPQVSKNNPYDFKADMYSLGVVFFLMLFYDRDFQLIYNFRKAQQFMEMREKNMIHKFDCKDVSKESLDFLKKTLVCVSKRMTSDEALSHQLFMNKTHEDNLDQNFDFHVITSKNGDKIDQQLHIKTIDSFQQVSSVKKEHLQIKNDKCEILNEQYFQCLKAEWILNRLILPLEECRLLDKKNQHHLELLYLLLVRCRSAVSQAQYSIKQRYNSAIVVIFIEKVKQLDQRINAKFQLISNQLKDSEDRFRSMIKEKIIKLTNKSSFNDRQKFLTGVQGLDFSRKELIEFTYSKYIFQLIEEVQMNQKQQEKVKEILKIYKRIVTVQLKDVKGVSLNQYILNLIQGSLE